MTQNAAEIKQRILYYLKVNGPSLPITIARDIKSNTIFSSAFLSELFNEKAIKMSYLRIGSSPLYFLTGQEFMLENFAHHLKGKEKEAFNLLKDKKFLSDSVQSPPIRVALHSLRDFALPFKNGEEIIWRYFLTPETEFEKPEIMKEANEEIKIPLISEIEKPLDISLKPRGKRKVIKRKTQQKEKFFDIIKRFLSEKAIELKDVEGFTKNEIILRVLDKGEEKLLIAYNKRKIADSDIIKAHKKVSSRGVPYMLLGLTEPSKKTSELIKAMKDLSSMQGIK